VSTLSEYVAINNTSYKPGILYVTIGLLSVEIAGVPPGKFHLIFEGDPKDSFRKLMEVPLQIL